MLDFYVGGTKWDVLTKCLDLLDLPYLLFSLYRLSTHRYLILPIETVEGLQNRKNTNNNTNLSNSFSQKY